MRFEKELQQKELRQEMKLRLARLQQQQQLIQNRPHIIISDPHVIGTMVPKTVALKTPSPITPSSLDEFLPCVIETVEVSYTTDEHSNMNTLQQGTALAAEKLRRTFFVSLQASIFQFTRKIACFVYL